MTRSAPPFTKEENSLARFYQALQDEKAVPSVADFAPYGEYYDIAVEMCKARTAGLAELRRYIKAFNNNKTAQGKRIVQILSGHTPTEDIAASEVGILLSEVKPEQVQWLWKPRLALGKMTMLDGDPGLGKSKLTSDLAARVSRGDNMPDGTPGIAGGVVLITPEDGLADTIQPTLARAGADLTKIVSIGSIETTDPETGYTYNRPFTLPDDLARLESAIDRVQAKFVIIDPVMAIVGGKSNTYKDNEVRAMLAPVQMLIEKARAACILVRHMTKNGGDNALYRGGGSIAFIGLARTGLMVVRDPVDDSKCVLAHIKSNIGKLGPALSYSIVSDEDEGDERPYVHWQGESEHTVRELMSPVNTSKPGTGRQDIMRVLNEKAPEAFSPKDLQEFLPDMSVNNLTVTLRRMVEDGEIEKSARGLYCAKSK